MSIRSRIIAKYPNWFAFLPAAEIHPHDHFMERAILRLFPPTVTPNQVTMFRFLATPVVFFITVFEWYVPGTILFLLVAFTDAIDGSLARTRHQILNSASCLTRWRTNFWLDPWYLLWRSVTFRSGLRL